MTTTFRTCTIFVWKHVDAIYHLDNINFGSTIYDSRAAIVTDFHYPPISFDCSWSQVVSACLPSAEPWTLCPLFLMYEGCCCFLRPTAWWSSLKSEGLSWHILHTRGRCCQHLLLPNGERHARGEAFMGKNGNSWHHMAGSTTDLQYVNPTCMYLEANDGWNPSRKIRVFVIVFCFLQPCTYWPQPPSLVVCAFGV